MDKREITIFLENIITSQTQKCVHKEAAGVASSIFENK